MSRMTREDMLRELELLPVWQLREPAPAQLKPLVATAAAVHQVLEQVSPALEMAVIKTPEPEISALDAAVMQTLPEITALIVQPNLSLRMLLSENGDYAFLLEPAIEQDAQVIETLLQNMLKAMHVNCSKEIANANVESLAEHAPRVIISMGETPANVLLGKLHTVEEWRTLQMESQIDYQFTPIVVTYHPAHLLQNMADKANAWRDLCWAKKVLQNL